jgi:peptide/nickel transport system substrate-binding protein
MYLTVRPMAVLMAAATILAACASPDTGGSTRGDPASASRGGTSKRVVGAIHGDPATLSSTINSAGVGRERGINELELMIHAGLTLVDGEGVRRPQLAEQVPSTENGLWRVFPDGRMETTWRIRETARWHDGTPFTVDDLLFTVRVGQDRELGILTGPGLDLIEGMQATDQRKLVITWKEPFMAADAMFTPLVAMPLPKHLLERPYQEEKAAFADIPYWTNEFIGAGPFQVRDFVRSAFLVLQANDQYVLGRPKLDAIEVRFIPDLNALVTHLLSGDVEVAIGRSLAVEHAVDLRDRWMEGTVAVKPAANWVGAFPQHLNPSPSVLNEVQFRRALYLALDRQQMVDTLLYGMLPVAHSFLSPAQAEYAAVQEYVVRHDYDPRAATQIVEGFGFSRGPDGFLRDPSGERLTVEARATGGEDAREKMIFVMAEDWKRIGIYSEALIIPRQRQNDREWRLARPGFEVVNQPSDVRGVSRFHSQEIPTAENNYRGNNRGRYSSPELDALLDRFLATIPHAERTRVLGEIIRHMTERLVTLDLSYNGDVGATNKRLKNVQPGDPWNAYEWEAS